MKNKILISFAGIVMFAIIVSALIAQENNLYYGTIDSNGTLITTTIPITNVSAIGFICTNINCSSVNGSLWNGQVLNSGNTSKISVTYPTELQGAGYGLFFYKEGYIPHEVFATWAGSGEAPAGTRYLTKKENCAANITGYNVSYASGNLVVTADIASPIEHAGPLSYVPDSLASFYDVNVKAIVSITGTSSYNAEQELVMNYSGQKTATFQIPLGNGQYNVAISSLANDAQCLNASQVTRNAAFNVTEAPQQTTSKEKKKKVIGEVEEEEEAVAEPVIPAAEESEIITLKPGKVESEKIPTIAYLLAGLSIIVLIIIIILILARR